MVVHDVGKCGLLCGLGMVPGMVWRKLWALPPCSPGRQTWQVPPLHGRNDICQRLMPKHAPTKRISACALVGVHTRWDGKGHLPKQGSPNVPTCRTSLFYNRFDICACILKENPHPRRWRL